MRHIFLAFLLAAAACGGRATDDPSPTVPPAGGPSAPVPGDVDAGTPDAGPVAPADPALAGCPMFPADHDWNREVSSEPADARSNAYLAFMGASWRNLHADFGANPIYGVPFVVVPGSQPRVAMSFLYSGESDPGPYPYPADIAVQGGPGAAGDRHAIALDRDSCLLYETYDTHWNGSGYRAGSGAIFDLRTGALRKDGWTSATASGLPILSGLARYDEVAEQKEIRHALTFTATRASRAWVHPATHYGNADDADAPPMGTRVRLK